MKRSRCRELSSGIQLGGTTPALSLIVVLAVCGCGDADDTDPDGGSDASTDTTTDASPDVVQDTVVDTGTDVTDDEVEPTCIPEATPSGDSGHAPGMDCMSCHATMTGPLKFTLAGTLFDDATGSSPVGGATVVVTDDSGDEIRLVTHPSGNFYTTIPIDYPALVEVSKCPDTAVMLTTFETGGCNSCHDSAFRVHLP